MKKISVLIVSLVCLSISAYSQFRNSAPASVIPNLQELSSETEQDIIVEKLYEALTVSDYPIPAGYLTFRSKKLSCYNNIELIEVTVDDKDNVLLYYLLQNEDEYYLLDGNLHVFEAFNKANKVLLNDRNQILEYLHLYVNSLSIDNSRFRLIKNTDELCNYMDKDASFDFDVEKPVMLSSATEDYQISVNVLCDKKLYKAKFTVAKNGRIDLDEEILIAELDILNDSHIDGCLQLNNQYEAKGIL